MARTSRQNKFFNRYFFSILTCLFIGVLSYQILLNPFIFGKLLKSVIYRNTQTSLQCQVNRSSLLYGFELSDVRLVERKSNRPLLEAKLLKISWFLPAILAGHIGVRELRIVSPRFYLIRDNGVWNWHSFIKPSPDDDEEFEIPDILRLYLELRVYLKIIIEDFAFHFEDISNSNGIASKTTLDVEKVDFQLGLLTHPFSSIPMNFDAVYIFKSVILALNPHRPLHLKLEGAQRLEGDLDLQALMLFENDQGSHKKSEFALRLDGDTTKLAMYSPKGKFLGNSGLRLGIDSSYDATQDRLLVHRFKLNHLEEEWISVQAKVDSFSVPERHVNLHLGRSVISLAKIDKLIGIIGNEISQKSLIGGTVRIEPTTIQGTLDELEINAAFSADRVFINAGDGHALDRLNLQLKAGLDLYRHMPPRMRPANYNEKRPLAFGVIRHANLPALNLVYNKAALNANAVFDPDSGLKLALKVRNFLWEQYLKEYLQGVSSLELDIKAPVDFSRLNFNGALAIKNARYYLKRSRSGFQNLQLTASGSLGLQNDIVLDLNHVLLQVFSPKGEQMIFLNGKSSLNFSNDQDYRIKIARLNLNAPAILPVLPGVIQDDLKPFNNYLSGGVILKTDSRLQFNNDFLTIKGKSQIEIPYLKLHDLDVGMDLGYKKEVLNIRNFNFAALKGAFKGQSAGHIDLHDAEEVKPDIQLSLELSRENFMQVHPDIKLLGKLAMVFVFKPEYVSGKIDMQNLDLDYQTNECTNIISGKACKTWKVRQLNLNLPFQHTYKLKHKVILTQNPARDYLDSSQVTAQKNLSIHSLASNFNPQSKYLPTDFYYLGSPQKNVAKGVTASVFYKKNIIVVNDLDVNLFKVANQEGSRVWQHSGNISGKNIYMNLADLKDENMEAGLNLQVKNLDLEPFLPESQSSYDGIISADVKGTISSFDSPLFNTTAYLSVFKISREFSGFVTRVIMPARVVALVVRNTLEIPRINVELKNGLVYSSIKVNRARLFPGLFVAPGSDELKQERMPLAKFLEKARSEVGTIAKENKSEDP